MARIVKPICMVLVAVALMAAVVPRSEAAVGCGTVVTYLNPCIPYATNRGPLGKCCGGVKGLYGLARTTADRRSVCSCLKTLAGSISGVNYGRAAGLPGQCGVKIPYKISPSTDCSRVN